MRLVGQPRYRYRVRKGRAESRESLVEFSALGLEEKEVDIHDSIPDLNMIQTIEKVECLLCRGRLSQAVISELVNKAVEKLNGFEFRSFVVGALVPNYVKALEEKIISEFMLMNAENIKKEIVRRVGMALAERIKRPVKFFNPDMVIYVDIYTGNVDVQPSHLYVYGRYLKKRPGISQTPWYCWKCWGDGCDLCDFTGRRVQKSVAEFIGSVALKLSGAVNYRFHAAGREDVDARVEGSGRPFIVELISPRLRTFDLSIYDHMVRELSNGDVIIKDLSIVDRSKLKSLKERAEKSMKRYEVLVEFERDIDDEELSRVIESLNGRTIEQRTPLRVLKRKGDKTRYKRVYSISARRVDGRTIVFDIICEAGLYVKELIHGDEGRTIPSVYDVLGLKPLKIELTVLEVIEG